MNANELADELDACANATMETLFKNKTEAGSLLWNIKVTDVGQRKQAATMLRQQQAEIEALKNLVAEQDKKIVELAFRAVYAERGNEVAKELSK